MTWVYDIFIARLLDSIIIISSYFQFIEIAVI